jgi:hypothetical protein
VKIQYGLLASILVFWLEVRHSRVVAEEGRQNLSGGRGRELIKNAKKHACEKFKNTFTYRLRVLSLLKHTRRHELPVSSLSPIFELGISWR